MAAEANAILQRHHVAVILARRAVEDNDGPHTGLLENPVALRLSRKGTRQGPFSYAMHIVQNSRIRAQG